MTTARPCAHPPCLRTTRDSSGRCHDHRVIPSASALAPPPSAPLPAEPSRRTEYTIRGERHVEWVGPNGDLHREDGPAQTIRFEETGGTRETYLRNGAIHRVDGPAYIGYRADGSVAWTDHYFENEELGGEVDLFMKLDSLTDERLREEFSTSSYAPLLAEGHGAREILRARVTGVRTLDGIREVIGGAAAEWVRSYEEGQE